MMQVSMLCIMAFGGEQDRLGMETRFGGTFASGAAHE